MTEQENILRLARDAGITFKPMVIEGEEYEYMHVACDDDIGGDEAGCIERFYTLVRAEAVAETLEACAKVCERISDAFFQSEDDDDDAMCAAMDCEEAIRAMAATPSREGEA